MSEQEITRRDVTERARVRKVAEQDPRRAVEIARGIKHPWYRCQALSIASEHLAGRDQEKTLLAALEAAKEQHEVNRVVTVSSWPIQVLSGTSPDLAARRIEELVSLANSEPHNLRRAHALQALAFAVRDHPNLLGLVVPALVEALLGGGGPRIDRCIEDTFELVRAAKPESLKAIAMHHKANRRRERLLESLV
ncbi:hypothetical protein AB4Y64_09045 [Lysobacter sp. TAF61]|uniref:hypothetical protein n=1 Tax=Lysobacter sp. TAF61 TaxID=3233072 RepID=UPI003F97A6D6